MVETLVLDANAFNDPGLYYFLKGYDGKKVLPAVAGAELYRHVREQRRWSREQYFQYLRGAGTTIEPLDARLALLAVERAGAGFTDRLADALIAAHALAPGRLLVTNNLADYAGIPAITPAHLMQRES